MSEQANSASLSRLTQGLEYRRSRLSILSTSPELPARLSRVTLPSRRTATIVSILLVAAILVAVFRDPGAAIAGVVVAAGAWLFPAPAKVPPSEPRESASPPETTGAIRPTRAVRISPARCFIAGGAALLVASIAWAVTVHFTGGSSLYWEGPVNLTADRNPGVALDYKPVRLDNGTGHDDLIINASSNVVLVAPRVNEVGIWHGPSLPSIMQCMRQLTAAGSPPSIERRNIRDGDSICLRTGDGRLAVIHINQLSAPTVKPQGLSAEVYVYDLPSDGRS